MHSPLFYFRLSRAIAVSVCVLAAAIAIQGVILFPRQLRALRDPPTVVIHRFFPLEQSGSAVLHVLHGSDFDSDKPLRGICKVEFNSDGPKARPIPVGFNPWTATASSNGRIFATSADGKIYSLDVSSPLPSPRLLGTHPLGLIGVLQCSHDGSVAIAANHQFTTVWRYDQPTPLWQRADLNIMSVRFHSSSRAFCGLSSGEIVAIDPCSGETTQSYHPHCGIPLSLDISQDGKQLAVIGDHGCCVVMDLETGQPLWKKRFPEPTVGPKFSPTGEILLAPREARAVHVLSAATGELVTGLDGANAEITGLAVSEHGIAYAWDSSGVVTAWRLTSRSFLHQRCIECLPAKSPSS